MGFRILVVDDDALQLRLLSKVIREWKPEYQVTALSHPAEALRLLHSQPFDILLTDIKMPQMDGLELIRRIRDEVPDPVQIIILSGFGEFEYAKQAIRYGVSDYLLKPIGKKSLMDALNAAEEKLGRGRVPEAAAVGLEYVVYRLLNTGAALREEEQELFLQKFPAQGNLCCLLAFAYREEGCAQLAGFRELIAQQFPGAVICGPHERDLAAVIPCGVTLSLASIARQLRAEVRSLYDQGLACSIGIVKSNEQLHGLYGELHGYLACSMFSDVNFC